MKKEDSKEIEKESLSSLAQILMAAASVATIADPVIAAGTGALMSNFFNLRGQLKKNRVYNFVSSFGKYMTSIDKDFDWENANTDDFGDFFEELLLSVSKTGHKGKIERLKLVTAGQILMHLPLDHISRYLTLVDKLSDIQVIILNKYMETEKEFIEVQDSLDKLYNEEQDIKIKKGEISGTHVDPKYLKILNDGLKKLERRIFDKQNEYNKIRRSRNEEIKVIGEEEFNLELNDLKQLGLIFNPSNNRADDIGEYSGYRISSLAIGFMVFLKSAEK